MKKRAYAIIILILLILNLIFPLIISEDQNPPNLPAGTDKLQAIGARVSDIRINDYANDSYLRMRWEQIIKNDKTWGSVLKEYQNISPYTDPFFKFFIGIEPAVSYLFFLTFIIWITFVIWIFRALSVIRSIIKFALIKLSSSFIDPLPKWTRYVISFAVVMSLSYFGITKKIAEIIINAIDKMNTNEWIRAIVAVIIAVIIFLSWYFSKEIEKVSKNYEKKWEELKRQGETKSGEEIVNKFAKGIEKGLKK